MKYYFGSNYFKPKERLNNPCKIEIWIEFWISDAVVDPKWFTAVGDPKLNPNPNGL